MQIWKFEIPVTDFLVPMPKGAKVLSVGVQELSIMAWALVDPSMETVTRRLPVYGTGHEIKDDAALPFIGTVFWDTLVFHVFDGGEIESN